MTAWQSGDVTANGIRIHYTRTGGAKPPLVLAHGFSDDSLCWTPVAEQLEGSCDVIMVDARCHGESEAPDRPFSSEDQASDLAGAIIALNLEKPFILGHSMGAMTALLLAGLYPDLPRAILLEDPPARWMPDAPGRPTDDGWAERMRTWLTGLKTKSREQLVAEQRVNSPAWSEAELGPWADSKLRLHLNVFNRSRDAEPNWAAIIQGITCPVLLITADTERGAIVNTNQAAALQSVVPQTQVAHIPGAGHSIRREQFEPYMDVVRGFLAEH